MTTTTSSDSPAAAAAAATFKGEQQRWHQIVERLSQQTELDGQGVQSLLAEAVGAAQADEQWSNSGLLELLCRARDSAAAGFPDTARKSAVGLLGFHLVVERYRAAHPVGSGDGKLVGADEPEVASAAAESMPDTPGTDASTEPSNAVPRRSGERKRRRSIAEQIPLEEEGSPAAAAGATGTADPASHQQQQQQQERMGVWHGPIHLQLGAACEEFCSVAVQVPSTVLDELPPVLTACSIKQRRGLRTKGQIACRTSVTRAGPRQLAELYQMAQHELVAIVPLEDCAVILAPYLTEAVDPHSNLNFKVATFIAALCA